MIKKILEEKSNKLGHKDPTTKKNRAIVNRLLERIGNTFDSFNVKVEVVEVHIQDDCILFDLELARGTRVSQVLDLKEDLALTIAPPTGEIEMYRTKGRNLIEIKVPLGVLKIKTEKFKIIRIEKDLLRISDLTRFRIFISDILKALSQFFGWLDSKIRPL